MRQHKKIKIVIGNDHAGTNLKKEIVACLTKNKDLEVIDYGTSSYDSVDYPTFGFAVACAIQNNFSDLGIVICGTGVGIANAVNRYQNVNCMVVEHEALIQDNWKLIPINVIAFGARVSNISIVFAILKKFFSLYKIFLEIT